MVMKIVYYFIMIRNLYTAQASRPFLASCAAVKIPFHNYHRKTLIEFHERQ